MKLKRIIVATSVLLAMIGAASAQKVETESREDAAAKAALHLTGGSDEQAIKDRAAELPKHVFNLNHLKKYISASSTFLNPVFDMATGEGESKGDRKMYVKYRGDIVLASFGEFSKIMEDEAAYIAAVDGDCILNFGDARNFSVTDKCSYPRLLMKAFARLYLMNTTEISKPEERDFIAALYKAYMDRRSFHGAGESIIAENFNAKFQVKGFAPGGFQCDTFRCFRESDARTYQNHKAVMSESVNAESYRDRGRTNQEFSEDYANSAASQEAGWGANNIGRDYTYIAGEMTWFISAFDDLLRKNNAVTPAAKRKALQTVTFSVNPQLAQYDSVLLAVAAISRNPRSNGSALSMAASRLSDSQLELMSKSTIIELDQQLSTAASAAMEQPVLYFINALPNSMRRWSRGARVSGVKDKRYYKYVSGMILRYEAGASAKTDLFKMAPYRVTDESSTLIDSIFR